MTGKIYRGSRTIDGIEVLVDGQALDPRYDIRRYTRGGFEWTYVGPEPTQLALALLADHLGDDQEALALAEGFAREIVANLENDWQMSGEEIAKAITALDPSPKYG